jgi:hypothetical protein
MANLSRMRGSIGLDVNAVCHVALVKRIDKEEEGLAGAREVRGAGQDLAR